MIKPYQHQFKGNAMKKKILVPIMGIIIVLALMFVWMLKHQPKKLVSHPETFITQMQWDLYFQGRHDELVQSLTTDYDDNNSGDAAFLVGAALASNEDLWPVAKDWFEIAIQKGSAHAHYNLAVLLFNEDSEKNATEIEKNLQVAADLGLKDASRSLGLLYMKDARGRLFDPDAKKALKYFNQAIAQGDRTKSLANKGGVYLVDESVRNISKGLKYIDGSLAPDNLAPIIVLLDVYEEGYQDFPADPEKAQYYYDLMRKHGGINGQDYPDAHHLLTFNRLWDASKTADYLKQLEQGQANGNRDATLTLAYMYRNGILVKEEVSQAVNLYESVAREQNSGTIWDSGLTYYLYELTIQNYRPIMYPAAKGLSPYGHNWTNAQIMSMYKAAKENQVSIPEAQFALYLIVERGMQDEALLSSIQKLITDYPKHYFGYYALGQLHAKGLLVPQDWEKALAYHQKATEFSQKTLIQYALAEDYVGLNQKDQALAIYENILAKDQYESKAAFGLAQLKRDDLVAEGKANEYIQLLKKASHVYSTAANYELGKIYEQGDIVPANIGTAKEYYISIYRGYPEAAKRLVIMSLNNDDVAAAKDYLSFMITEARYQKTGEIKKVLNTIDYPMEILFRYWAHSNDEVLIERLKSYAKQGDVEAQKYVDGL